MTKQKKVFPAWTPKKIGIFILDPKLSYPETYNDGWFYIVYNSTYTSCSLNVFGKTRFNTLGCNLVDNLKTISGFDKNYTVLKNASFEDDLKSILIEYNRYAIFKSMGIVK